MYTQVHTIVSTHIISGNTNLRDPGLLKSRGLSHPTVTLLRPPLSALTYVGVQKGQCLSGLMREAQLISYGLHCNSLVMEKTNIAKSLWDAVWFGGFHGGGGSQARVEG